MPPIICFVNPRFCAIINSSEAVKLNKKPKTKKAAPSPSELDTLPTNRQIKDGVFRLLYDNPENAAELYRSLTGEECGPHEVSIITITNVISGKLKNDLAFVAKGKAMVISEHMASPYENLPIRMLMYTG